MLSFATSTILSQTTCASRPAVASFQTTATWVATTMETIQVETWVAPAATRLVTITKWAVTTTMAAILVATEVAITAVEVVTTAAVAATSTLRRVAMAAEVDAEATVAKTNTTLTVVVSVALEVAPTSKATLEEVAEAAWAHEAVVATWVAFTAPVVTRTTREDATKVVVVAAAVASRIAAATTMLEEVLVAKASRITRQ